MSSQKRTGRFGSVGVVLFLGTLVVLGVLVPAAFCLRGECPNCRGYELVNYGIDEWWTKRHGLPTAKREEFSSLLVPCTRCSGTGKIPLIWTWFESEPPDVGKDSLLPHTSVPATARLP